MFLKTINEEQMKEILKEEKTDMCELKSKVLLLKEWLQQQTHLPQYMTESELQFFVWNCKFSLEKAKQKLDSYFTMRSLIPEFFSHRDPCTEQMLLHKDTIYFFPLPKLTKAGYRVMYIKFAPSCSNDYDNLTSAKFTANLTDYLIKNESLSKGLYIIVEGKSLTLGLLKQLHPSVLRKFLPYLYEVLPMRIKGTFVFNSPPIYNYFRVLIYPLLSKKMQQRIHPLTGDHTELYKYIDKEILPKEYGGEEASIDELRDEHELRYYLWSCKFSMEKPNKNWMYILQLEI
ncbi:alpha-tocopherol transfer protein-like isoform X2 [Lycorma delicatula]|uniref:alpha-tocopherol transfer protein-like isoform X2 n=1 Tax=Lycorma delicatula TaxID=130591 RepID=UPI003F511F8B